MFTKVVRSSLVGAGLGALTGMGMAFIKTRKADKTHVSSTDPDGLHQRIINLKYAPDAEEILNRLSDYKALDVQAHQDIHLNMDRLIGLYLIASSPDPVSASFDMKAHRYRENIKEALTTLATRYHNATPSKQFLDDREAVMKCADGYVFNLRQQMREKFASRQVNSV